MEKDGSSALQGDSGTESQGMGQESAPSNGGENSLYNEFLQGIPETQRPLIEPHVKQWDAQVTKKFQELHSKYDPYKSFLDGGVDPRTLQSAHQIYQMLESNPEQVYQLLHQQFGQQPGDEEQGLLGDEDEDDPEYPGLDKSVVQRLRQQEQILTKVAQTIIQKEQMSAEREEDAALDAYMENLKERFGDFDEDYVLQKIARGIPGEKAVEGFNQMLQQRLNAGRQQPNVPPSLSGGGAPPSEGFNPSEIPSKDLRGMVADILRQNAAG